MHSWSAMANLPEKTSVRLGLCGACAIAQACVWECAHTHRTGTTDTVSKDNIKGRAHRFLLCKIYQWTSLRAQHCGLGASQDVEGGMIALPWLYARAFCSVERHALYLVLSQLPVQFALVLWLHHVYPVLSVGFSMLCWISLWQEPQRRKCDYVCNSFTQLLWGLELSQKHI